MTKQDIETKPAAERLHPSAPLTVILIAVLGGYLLLSMLRLMDAGTLENLKTFNTVFISILLQAFPFMLIGVLVSSAMHVFIPEDWIVKVFPMKRGLGFITAMFAGLLFPVCECAIVPVMTRLVKKGVAVPIAVTFMLSAPIINPIVIISTLYAFPGQPEIALMRVIFGLLIALLVGLVLMIYGKNLPVLLDNSHNQEYHCLHGAVSQMEADYCTCHTHDKTIHTHKRLADKIKDLFFHAGDEFFNAGKYLVIGACITSLFQALIPQNVFAGLGTQSWLSLLVMMTAAFLFSACSTSDAFIARSFMSRFSMGAIMGFMVFGPMMDVKNLLMLLSSFKKGFIIRLTLLIMLLNFIVLSYITLLLF